MPNKEGVIRLQFTADAKAGTIEGKLLPKMKRGVNQDIRPYLAAVLSSINLGLTAVLGDLPILRPATEAEKSAKVYIFKDSEKDTALYKTRKAIYDTVASVFNNTLSNLFPDVQFIMTSQEYQQYNVTEMTVQEVEEQKKFIKDLAEEVKSSEE